MNCPVDQAAMRQLTDKGIVMDCCELCDGIWLDAGELTRLTQTTSDLPELPPLPKSTPPKTEGRPSCPRCRQTMEELPYLEGTSLLVDRCPRCRCLWLERGELQVIYDHITQKRQAQSPLQSGQPTQGDPLARMVLTLVLVVFLLAALLLVLFTLRR